MICKSKRVWNLFLHGVELNTDASGVEVDILGYFVDIEDPTFINMVEYRQGERSEEQRKWFQSSLSWDSTLPMKECEIAGGVIARPHIAQALIENGYASSQKDAYARLIGFGARLMQNGSFKPEVAINILNPLAVCRLLLIRINR